ncbi:MAG: T9SS type A sorting domain-containing protein [Candidatus Aegiribacteria sp.]|nr:T9SS type A sorting domain-containing protein [Candidatus Aegiribacteria sp.]
MYRIILPLLIIGSITVTYADSATQTDWSGGPGILGPVTVWGDDFYFDLGSTWVEYPGYLACARNYELVEPLGAEIQCKAVRVADIDCDGDPDLVGALYTADQVVWLENTDGSGYLWDLHQIEDYFSGAIDVHPCDMDGDGDQDVLGAGWFASGPEYVWWENVNGLGTVWLEHIVAEDFGNVYTVHPGDIDGDGDLDVVGASYPGNTVMWMENADSIGTSWIEHAVVVGSFIGPRCIRAVDMDKDGDLDILGAASGVYNNGDIIWWENLDGTGLEWRETPISSTFTNATSVEAGDVDGDGDIDVVGGACDPYGESNISWWENSDTSPGTYWIEHPITENFMQVLSVYLADIDCDEDLDILGSSHISGVAWFENCLSSGDSWLEHMIEREVAWPRGIIAADIIQSGCPEVLGATSSGIMMWNLDIYTFSDCRIRSSILNTVDEPDWDGLSWSANTPMGTSVVFQVRASPWSTHMGEWSDTLYSPCSLEGVLDDGDRYVQYRAILGTTDPDTTPILNDVTISWNPLGIEGNARTDIQLLSVSPNPCYNSPVIRFSLSSPEMVSLSVYDIFGRQRFGITDDEFSSGYHQVLSDGLTPGIYFCRMTAGEFAATQRFVVIR